MPEVPVNDNQPEREPLRAAQTEQIVRILEGQIALLDASLQNKLKSRVAEFRTAIDDMNKEYELAMRLMHRDTREKPAGMDARRRLCQSVTE